MKAYLISGNQASRGKVPDAVIHMLAGGLAGCVTWLPPVYSLDVVKTRVQTALPGTYRGPWDCAVKIWRCGDAVLGLRMFHSQVKSKLNSTKEECGSVFELLVDAVALLDVYRGCGHYHGLHGPF